MSEEKQEMTMEQEAASAPRVRFDTSDMKTAYSNMCNISSTREEVTLLFGTNQSWHAGENELTVRLSDRIILSPFVAKRMATLMANVVDNYENRFGSLDGEPPVAGDQA